MPITQLLFEIANTFLDCVVERTLFNMQFNQRPTPFGRLRNHLNGFFSQPVTVDRAREARLWKDTISRQALQVMPEVCLLAPVAFIGHEHNEELGATEETLQPFDAECLSAGDHFLAVWISIGTQDASLSLAKTFYWQRHGTPPEQVLSLPMTLLSAMTTHTDASTAMSVLSTMQAQFSTPEVQVRLLRIEPNESGESELDLLYGAVRIHGGPIRGAIVFQGLRFATAEFEALKCVNKIRDVTRSPWWETTGLKAFCRGRDSDDKINPFTSIWQAGLLHGGRQLSDKEKACIIVEIFDEITAVSSIDKTTLRYLFWGDKGRTFIASRPATGMHFLLGAGRVLLQLLQPSCRIFDTNPTGMLQRVLADAEVGALSADELKAYRRCWQEISPITEFPERKAHIDMSIRLTARFFQVTPHEVGLYLHELMSSISSTMPARPRIDFGDMYWQHVPGWVEDTRSLVFTSFLALLTGSCRPIDKPSRGPMGCNSDDMH